MTNSLTKDFQIIRSGKYLREFVEKLCGKGSVSRSKGSGRKPILENKQVDIVTSVEQQKVT